MKKLLSIMAIATLMMACSKEDSTTDVATATFTLTGYTSNNTRTEFGTPNDEWTKIPFLWSDGDMVWIDGIRSSVLSCSMPVASATFSVTNSPDDGDVVYYNMNATLGPNADIAVVPASQSTANSLGKNGDFGYASVENGAFTLSHATSYLWFDIEALPEGYSLNAIRLNAGDAIVAGKAKWDGLKFGTPTNGSSVIDLAVDKDATMVAMVVLPTTIESATITYELSDGTNTKYYEQTLSKKEIASGKTYRIAINLATAELYELRVLTFEDGTEGWEPYECNFFYAMNYSEEYKLVEKWSDYIPRDGQYGNGHGSYEWYDEDNTELAFVKPEIESWWGISGHAGISDYVGTDEDISKFADDNMLFMIDLQAYNVKGGANGSKNFCSQYGYLDPDEYATQYSPSGVLPGLQFMDEKPRVIDHMYVTNTTYAYAIIVRGECDFGGSYEYTDESTFKIVAYGYDSFDDDEPTITEFHLLNTGKRIVTDWTKWDLSVLGEVVRVEFNLVACYEGYGRYGLVIPAYFAYDDVAVRF